ncbi:MAG: amino acid ABC transporter permease [Proteobacteria bacterium]|nr:amino acid ABC transporter permease [Pseudomonadota bacterium]
MNYDWNWSIFLAPTIDGASRYVWWILSGLAFTVFISLCAWAIALVIGIGLGVTRTLPPRLGRALATAYVELFRNVPLLVQLFFWYYIAPVVFLPVSLQTALNRANPVATQTLTMIVCLGLFTAARVCEQVRAGIQAQPRGRFNAGYALGLTRIHVYRFVILPLAFRVIVPPLTSEFLNVFKNSAVALTIGLLELTARSRQMGEFTAHVFEAFIAATLLYFLIAQITSHAMHALEARLRIPGHGLGGSA